MTIENHSTLVLTHKAAYLRLLSRLLLGLVIAAASTMALAQNTLATAHRYRPGMQRPSAVTGGETVPAGTTPKWTLLFPSNFSDFIDGHTAVYDGATNSMIVFGGYDLDLNEVVNGVTSLSQANGLSTGAWSTVIANGAAGAPPARASATAVYDSANSRMMVFGGCTFTGVLCTTLNNDVWVLSNANGVGGTPTWTQMSPTGSLPAGRWAHTAVYDTANNRMVIFGGDNLDATYGDTWVLSNANGLGGTPAWTQLAPTGTPDGQDGATAVYDSTHNVMVTFGGRTSTFADVNTVWTLSNANGMGGTPAWTKLTTSGPLPGKRDSHTAVYDQTNNRMIIFGGESNTANGWPYFQDTWVLSSK